MPTFEFRATFDEWWTMLDAILDEHRMKFAVDKSYEEPRCGYYDHLTEELKQAIFSGTRRIFLLSPAFSTEPLFLRLQPTGINQGKYFIDIARGGPSMDMSMCPRFEEGGLSWFAEADLGCQNRYWDESLINSYRAPRDLVRLFVAIKKTLQQHLLRKTIHGHVRWVSPEVWHLFETGKAALRLDGKCYNVHGEVPAPSAWRKKPIIRSSISGGVPPLP
jgi:hypothetical protein